MIRVQREDFDVGAELAALSAGNAAIGGIVSFVGLVRDLDGPAGPGSVAVVERVSAMTLEHYPGMTEKMLAEVAAEAQARWPLEATLIIHRYGALAPGDRIVLVACASAHRQAAFDACNYLIDWLKTKAPFWKREETGSGPQWVAARADDDQAAARWLDKGPDAAE